MLPTRILKHPWLSLLPSIATYRIDVVRAALDLGASPDREPDPDTTPLAWAL
jgi:hypothetical protein